MKPIEFEGQNLVFAKDQPEYSPLPAHRDPKDETGTVTSCWELSPEEIETIKSTGKIYLQCLTFWHPPQPLSLHVENPIV